MPTRWNPADTSALHQFSNGDLTLTRITTNNQYAMTRGSRGRSTGKYYFEVRFTFTGTGMSAGIANSATALDSVSIYAGNNTNSIIVGTNSQTTFNNTNLGSPGTVTSNQWLGFAIDLDNKKWWTVVSGGNWNNDVIENQNPALNVGGYSFATIAAGPYYPLLQSYRTSDHSGVANFGATRFVFNPPSGFGMW